jgi:hypothetical protein
MLEAAKAGRSRDADRLWILRVEQPLDGRIARTRVGPSTMRPRRDSIRLHTPRLNARTGGGAQHRDDNGFAPAAKLADPFNAVARWKPASENCGPWRLLAGGKVNPSYANWRDYQHAVAAFFRERGCASTVEAPVTGARATHKIDVYVTFRQHGVDVRWLIECKLWKSRVEKAQVLTLKAIVDDVGADRGIIFCESEFQSGARDAARHTNVLLVSSLEEFKRTVSFEDSRVMLIYRETAPPNNVPVYAFPGGAKPEHLLLYEDRIFVANWEPGNIAVIDPASKSIESVIDLDKYEATIRGKRTVNPHPPGNMVCADGRLFVGAGVLGLYPGHRHCDAVDRQAYSGPGRRRGRHRCLEGRAHRLLREQQDQSILRDRQRDLRV